jgi:hypothetical protein
MKVMKVMKVLKVLKVLIDGRRNASEVGGGDLQLTNCRE